MVVSVWNIVNGILGAGKEQEVFGRVISMIFQNLKLIGKLVGQVQGLVSPSNARVRSTGCGYGRISASTMLPGRGSSPVATVT
jgi:hypothetical protein